MYVYIIKKKIQKKYYIYIYIYIFVNKKFFVKAVQIFDNDIWEKVYFNFFCFVKCVKCALLLYYCL